MTTPAADKHAFPVPASEVRLKDTIQIYGPNAGMTLREWYAGLAMQGLLSDPNWQESAGHTARTAVMNADALLAALAEP